MSIFAIRSELEQKLNVWADANPDVDVVLEGEAYDKADTPFVAAYLLPSVTKDVTVDGTRQRYLGIFQLNVWTKDNIGTGESDRIVDSLISHFPIIPKTGRVSVDKTPYASRFSLEDGFRVTPITIYYRYES